MSYVIFYKKIVKEMPNQVLDVKVCDTHAEAVQAAEEMFAIRFSGCYGILPVGDELQRIEDGISEWSGYAKIHSDNILLKSKKDLEDPDELWEICEVVSESTLLHSYIDSRYIASKLWSREDVGGRLLENGYADTDANIDVVLGFGNQNVKHLNDCLDEEWATIDMAIQSVEDQLHFSEEV